MIGKLKGKIEEKFEDHCYVDVGGVCYVVYCASKTLQNLKPHDYIELFIHTMVKDELPILYGFNQYNEKELFTFLVLVQGVGGRMALSLLDSLGCHGIAVAIQQGNSKALQQVNGIGNKIAMRIVNELKSNKKLFNFIGNDSKNLTTGISPNTDDDTKLLEDGVSALTNLGFKKSKVVQVINNTMQENPGNISLENLIKLCITKLSRKK